MHGIMRVSGVREGFILNVGAEGGRLRDLTDRGRAENGVEAERGGCAI